MIVNHSLPILRVPARFISHLFLLCALALWQPQLRAEQWPTFHGNYALTGYAAATIPPEPRLLWSFQADSKIMAAPVSDGSLIFFATEIGTVYALNQAGAKKWSLSLASTNKGDAISIVAPLAVIENSVVATTLQGLVFRLRGETTNVVWRHDTEEPIMAAATWYKPEGGPGRVIVLNQSSGRLRALNVDSGEMIWETAGAERADGHLTLANEKLVFGSCASAIHTVSAIDGLPGASIPLGQGAEIAGGVAAAGMRIFTGNRSGAIVAVDLNANTSVWVNTEWSGELFTTPAVHEQRVIVANGEGDIVCVNADTGKKKWVFKSGANDARSPVIAGDAVVASLDGTLHVLGLADGKKIWSFDISDEITSPAIVNNMIVVGTDEGQVLCFGE